MKRKTSGWDEEAVRKGLRGEGCGSIGEEGRGTMGVLRGKIWLIIQ